MYTQYWEAHTEVGDLQLSGTMLRKLRTPQEGQGPCPLICGISEVDTHIHLQTNCIACK